MYQLRRWYEQFYVDAADVTEEMTQRFEYEIDTTKALENWSVEVEDNLRRQAAGEDTEQSVRAEQDKLKATNDAAKV